MPSNWWLALLLRKLPVHYMHTSSLIMVCAWKGGREFFRAVKSYIAGHQTNWLHFLRCSLYQVHLVWCTGSLRCRISKHWTTLFCQMDPWLEFLLWSSQVVARLNWLKGSTGSICSPTRNLQNLVVYRVRVICLCWSFWSGCLLSKPKVCFAQ